MNFDIIFLVFLVILIFLEFLIDLVILILLIFLEFKGVNVSIDSIIDWIDEIVRNCENMVFVFKEDYLLNVILNILIIIDLISNNSDFDFLLEVY